MSAYFYKRRGILAFKKFRNKTVRCRNFFSYTLDRAHLFSKLKFFKQWVKRYSKYGLNF